jgi:hypothetical protein
VQSLESDADKKATQGTISRMRFEEFAAAHGLLLRHVEFGKWVRVPTTDKPTKKNGAYKHAGDHAHVQNHATMGEVATWFPDSSDDIRIDADAVRRRCEKAARELQEGRQKAAKRAADMLRQCSLERHAYLDGKGFPDERGNVLALDSGPLLLIPMRVAGRLVGVQTITTDGEKKFLFGQQCSGAEYVIDNKGRDFFCEGYATGLECPRCAVGAEDALPGACLLFGAQPGQASRQLRGWDCDRGQRFDRRRPSRCAAIWAQILHAADCRAGLQRHAQVMRSLQTIPNA